MNKIIYILVLLCVFSNSLVQAQQSSLEALRDYAVDTRNIAINGMFPLYDGITPEMLHEHFGEPDLIYSYEFFSYILTVHKYGENEFPFIDYDGRLTMFKLQDNQFSVQIEDITIRVGDSIDAFAQRFPEIYASTWTSQLTGEKAVNVLYIAKNRSTGELVLADDYLVILRNDAGIITRIYEYGHY